MCVIQKGGNQLGMALWGQGLVLKGRSGRGEILNSGCLSPKEY